MTISYDLPDTITIVPTAQSIHDALAVSPYMDHVVDAWINAYVASRVANALYAASYTTILPDSMQGPASDNALKSAHSEMLERWHSYRG